MANEQSLLADRVRTLRESKGWTVTETARRAGLSTSMLWKVENGQTSLTYQKLLQLAAGLEVPIEALFEVGSKDIQRGARRVIERQGEAPALDFGGNLHHFFATDIAHKDYFPCLIEVRAPSEDSQEAESHGGEEFVYVIEGVIEFRCEGYAPTRLQAGDCVYFDAALRHRYLCAEGEVARIMCVFSNPAGRQAQSASAHGASHPRALQLLTKGTGGSRSAPPAKRVSAPTKQATAPAKQVVATARRVMVRRSKHRS
jgi:transcriptional regulator with XRE-family HTH domain